MKTKAEEPQRDIKDPATSAAKKEKEKTKKQKAKAAKHAGSDTLQPGKASKSKTSEEELEDERGRSGSFWLIMKIELFPFYVHWPGLLVHLIFPATSSNFDCNILW